MKRILFLVAFIISAYSFAQNTGSISGNLKDLESNGEPLLFAKVTIKENGAEVLTDENGAFKFENLDNGKYTLVYSFTGYEVKEVETQIENGQQTNLELFLKASSLSLDDLMLTMASAEKQSTTSSNN